MFRSRTTTVGEHAAHADCNRPIQKTNDGRCGNLFLSVSFVLTLAELSYSLHVIRTGWGPFSRGAAQICPCIFGPCVCGSRAIFRRRRRSRVRSRRADKFAHAWVQISFPYDRPSFGFVRNRISAVHRSSRASELKERRNSCANAPRDARGLCVQESNHRHRPRHR
jgi:hypothetical protein